jgi:L-malate glycosyltransferase
MNNSSHNNNSTPSMDQKTFAFRKGLSLGLSLFLMLLKILSMLGRRQRKIDKDKGCQVLLTGTFYSDNWIMSHLKPLSMATAIDNVYIVSTYNIPPLPGVKHIAPSRFLIKLTGSTPARLLTFIYYGIKLRPHFIGGFHLLLNGLFALLLAQIAGAKSLYNCGGGVREIAGGGYSTENKLFKKIKFPDPIIEKKLLKAASLFDLIIVRGKNTEAFLREHGVLSHIHIVTGGIDGKIFSPAPPGTEKEIDLIITGRISSIKRMDLFIQAIKCLKKTRPGVKAVIIGDGPLRRELETLSSGLGLEDNIEFAGHQSQVAKWLSRAKIFVLTSDSEGVSLAMIEAMLCGLPAVVSDVGDLGEIVINGKNGYLIKKRTPENFADKFNELLRNPEQLAEFGYQANISANRSELKTIAEKWNNILVS